MEKSAWAIIALLSVLKVGGGFILLDPAHPAGRLADIARLVDTSQVLVSKTTAKI